MSFPVGIVCMGCGSVMGTMFSPVLPSPTLKAACLNCVSKASKKLGRVPTSEADWRRIAAALKG
jgi:hypothetical protein